jgi:hypothetical protein
MPIDPDRVREEMLERIRVDWDAHVPASYLVTSATAPWAEWTNHDVHVIGQVATPFDEPDHPYGQWTGRVRWIETNDDEVTLGFDFLVADFEFEPGGKLPFFTGPRHITDLVIKARLPSSSKR